LSLLFTYEAQSATDSYIAEKFTKVFKVLLVTLGTPWQDSLRVLRCPRPTFSFEWCSWVFI